MATMQELQQALIAADRAGATEDARMLASAIVKAQRTAGAGAGPANAPAQQADDRASSAPDDPGALGSLVIGAGRTFDRVGKGMQQLYYGAKSMTETPGLNDLVLGGTPSQRELAKLKATADEEDRLYKPLQEARPWSTGIGEAIPSMVIPAGGGATLLANTGRMAAAGALPGLLEYGSVQERAGRAVVGAAAGAAMPAVAAVGRTIGSVAAPLFEKGRERIAGRVLNRAAGDAAPEVGRRMAGAAELVPGSRPTAAQVSESGGIAALERAMSAANPEAYTQRAMEQSGARMQSLRKIAGTDAELAAAEATRAKSAKSGYQNAFWAGIDQDMATAMKPQIDALLSRPSIRSAMREARKLAAEDSIAIKKMGSVEGLHYLKLALDDIVEASANKPTKARLVSQTARDLQSVLEQIAPEYKSAVERYARQSQPINQMQVGRSLMDAVSPAINDFGGLARETGNSYAFALRNADQTAARATGLSGATMRNVMTPDQMRLLDAIGLDLGRKANAQDLGRGVGSDTFQKLSMDNLAQQSGFPRAVGGLLEFPGVSRGMRWAYKDSDDKMRGLLADVLLDPPRAAELMKRAGKPMVMGDSPRARLLLEQSLLRMGLLGAPAGYSLVD